MTELFKVGEPQYQSPMQSQVLRENFNALYNKVKTLEPRATSPISTRIYIEAGPVYFRSKESTQLKFINFFATEIDLVLTQGYKTEIGTQGERIRVILPEKGVSPFLTTQIQYYREVLISLTIEGRLIFTEGATTPTGISRSFDIAFADGDIPIALVMVKHYGDPLKYGQIQKIEQTSINDIRPFITSAFQNSDVNADTQQKVTDLDLRVQQVEAKNQIYGAGVVVLDYDFTSDINNKKIYAEAGNIYVGGKLVRFIGAEVDFTQSPYIPPALDSNSFNYCAIVYNDTSKQVETIHGTSSDSAADWRLVKTPSDITNLDNDLVFPYGIVPLSMILYRAIDTIGPTTEIVPLINYTHIGATRINYKFPIIAIDEILITIQIPLDVADDTFNQLYAKDLYVDTFIEIGDDNSQPIQRQIITTTRDLTLRTISVEVNKIIPSVISISNNAKAKDLIWNREVVDDIRPIGLDWKSSADSDTLDGGSAFS